MAGDSSSARVGLYVDDKGATKTVQSVQGSLQRLGQDVKGSILAGVGLGAGVTAFNMFSRAVGTAVDFLQQGIQSAIDDEASVRRLTAALQANIPGWDGSTAAIERTIKAGQDLGFTDDETRESIAFLTAATHDLNKAQQLNATAMDLARFKGISLQAASEALVKVEAGRYRLLASLGIQLREGATQTEALAAVQAVAAGQAEAFGDSTAGAMARAQIAIEEAGESMGADLLPMVAEVADIVAHDLVPALRSAYDGLQELEPVWTGLGMVIDAVGGSSLRVANQMREDAEALAATAAASGATTSSNWIAMGNTLREVGDGVSSDLDGIATDAGDLPGEMASAMLANEDTLTNAATELMNVTAEAMTPGQQRAAAIAFLTSDAYAQAIASGKPAAIARANELRAAAINTLHNLSGVEGGGKSIGGHWIYGITQAIYAGQYDVMLAANAIRNLLGHSLPTKGPLAGDAAERGGTSIGEAWAKAIGEGIQRNMPTLALPDAIGPGGFSSGTGSRGGFQSGGFSSGLPEIRIYLDGREMADSTARWTYYGASTTGTYPRG